MQNVYNKSRSEIALNSRDKCADRANASRCVYAARGVCYRKRTIVGLIDDGASRERAVCYLNKSSRCVTYIAIYLFR